MELARRSSMAVALIEEGFAVFVAYNTLCFSKEPLAQALRHIADLEFRKIDLAIVEGATACTPPRWPTTWKGSWVGSARAEHLAVRLRRRLRRC